MKNYKSLVPIALIVLYVLGVYMCGSNNLKIKNEYEQYLETARIYAEQEVEIYAIENYQNALKLKPSVELSLEVGTFYRDTLQNPNKAISWGEEILAAYPKLAQPYEFQLGNYLLVDDYAGFFELYDIMVKRNILPEEAQALYDSVEYTYFFKGSFEEMQIFSSNLSPYLKNENWGYCTSKGKKRIATLYNYAGYFANGMAPVIDASGEAYFIDNSGNKVMPVEVEGNIQEVGVMSAAEIYTVFDGEEWNYYNKAGEKIMGGFIEASTIANGVAAASTEEGWKIFDSSGKELNDSVFDEVVMDEKKVAYRNERLFVRDGNVYKMIDTKGEQIGKDTYEEVKVFSESTYAAVKKNDKWGFIDKDGEWYIEPQYEDARSFLNGFAAVKVNGLWGFINEEKDICIPCEFVDVWDFTANGTVPVRDDSKWKVLLLYRNNY